MKNVQVMQEIHTGFHKARGILMAQLAFYIVCTILLLAAGMLSYREYKDNTNRSTAMTEMEMLKNGVLTYTGLNKTSQPPANLGALVSNPSLKAQDAIDGVDHGPMVEKRTWTGSSETLLDPWGTPYELSYDASTGKGTITSKGNGKPLSVSF